MTHAADLPLGGAARRAAPAARCWSDAHRLARLLRFGSFYERVHAPTLGTTLGIGCVLARLDAVLLGAADSRLVLHEVLIAVLMVITTPVTLMLLVRAAIYRDRREGNVDVPPPLALEADRAERG